MTRLAVLFLLFFGVSFSAFAEVSHFSCVERNDETEAILVLSGLDQEKLVFENSEAGIYLEAYLDEAEDSTFFYVAGEKTFFVSTDLFDGSGRISIEIDGEPIESGLYDCQMIPQ